MSDVLLPLAAFCARHELPWDTEAARRFATYLELLQHFNKAMNLIGPMKDARVVETLFIDSVAAAAVAAPRGPILDVGSGAGLPGVPLAILYPELRVSLVEPRQKRTQFLTIARNRLGLEHLEVHRLRIEAFDGDGFDTVISKAFQPPVEWIETARARCAPDGRVLCLHAAAESAALRARAAELGLVELAAVDDVTTLGVAPTSVQRSIRAFGMG